VSNAEPQREKGRLPTFFMSQDFDLVPPRRNCVRRFDDNPFSATAAPCNLARDKADLSGNTTGMRICEHQLSFHQSLN
jgi:hypothetical protein